VVKLTLYKGNCLEVMKDLPDKSIDLVLTDPPFGIDYKSNHGSKKYKARVQNHTWDKEFSFRPYFSECYRVLKDDSYLLVFGRKENIALMEELGYNQLLVWDKQHNGMGNLLSWGIGYEFIFCFEKGTPSLRGGARVNGVISYKHIGFFEKTEHPTQKPVGLMEYIIHQTTLEGATVLDPFVGSGTTLRAGLNTGRNTIGIEINPQYIPIIKNGLNWGSSLGDTKFEYKEVNNARPESDILL
jgi:site-specific DNA-methyltransferase (adenine-specific)